MNLREIFLFIVIFSCIDLSAMKEDKSQKITELSAQEWDADKYDDTLQQSLVAHIINVYHLRILFQGVSCLDLGCGSGRITHLFREETGIQKIHGIDRSFSMIDSAQKNYYKEGCITFEQRCVEKLLDKNMYDCVVSFCSLHWIKDKKGVFKKIFNALKNDGCFFATCDAPSESTYLEDILNTIKNEFPSFDKLFIQNLALEDLFGRYQGSSEVINLLLQNAGFKDIVIESIKFSQKFTLEKYKKYQRAQVFSMPFMCCIPKEEHEQLFDRLIELLYNLLPKNQDDTRTFTVKTLIIKAFKPNSLVKSNTQLSVDVENSNKKLDRKSL